jgi:O-antigen/teichoic acid export membrane protein
MQLKTSLMKGGFHLLLGQVAVQASSFIRNIILAWIISPADFGIAAIFGITLQVIEVLSNVSTEMLLIQAEDGDQERLQGTAQLIRAGRGMANGLVIFALGGLFSRLFGVPQAAWAFRCLGLVPLLRGFMHLDLSRLQRHMRFWPNAIAEAGSSWFATLITIPLAFWLRDYSAMLWALIAQVGASALASHLLAERRYAWHWDRVLWRRMVSFGWPLMINGILMLGIFEGDRMIIGSSESLFPGRGYTLTDLGVYSATFSLTMAPTMFVVNIASSLFLPLLSRAQGNLEQFERRYAACSQAVCLAAAVISVLFIVAGGTLVTTIYGPKYAAAGAIIGWLGAMWGVRIVRAAPTLAAMAQGDTKNTMISNSARTLSLVGMLAALAWGGGLVWIAISGFAGELLALVASLWRLRSHNAISLALCVKPIGVAAAGMVMGALLAPGAGGGLVVALGFWLACTLALTAAMVMLFQSFRDDIWSVLIKSRLGVAVES